MALHNAQWTLYPASSFGEFRERWDRLNADSARSLLLNSRFVTPCLDAFGQGHELLAIAMDGDRCVAMALVEKVGLGRWQTVQPSQAPIGFFLCQADYFGEPLIQRLASSLPGVVITISITQQDPAILPRPQQSAQVKTLDYITTGRLDIPQDFDSYWASRGKNVRQNTNKARNRLSKEGISIKFDLVTDPSRAHQGVADYGELESAGWKSDRGTSVHIDNVQGGFYSAMLSGFMPEQGQLWRYFFDDTLVATDLCIHDGKVLYILKTTYDESYKKHSPAFMMHLDAIRYCAVNGFKSIEFYGPAMDWHKKLTQDLRTMYHLTWLRFSFLNTVKNALEFLK